MRFAQLKRGVIPGKAILAVVWTACVLAGGPSLLASGPETGIHGVVTSVDGKPIRAAIVQAKMGKKAISRFTQNDGTYRIDLPPGMYRVSVEAYGFTPKSESSVNVTRDSDVNFQLKEGFSMRRLTNAELQELLPENKETRFLRRECIACHSFGTIQNKSGYTAEEWAHFIPNMPKGKTLVPAFIPSTPGPKMTYLTGILEKYFGPEAAYFGPDGIPAKPSDVQHVEPAPAVLKATFTEYDLPDGDQSYAHSVVMNRNDDAWFSELGRNANKIAKFDPRTEKFEEYPARMPHTGAEGKDGLIWYSLVDNPDLASVDPATGKVTTYKIPGHSGPGTHTLAVDNDGNLWISGATAWKFDVKTHQFKEFKVPLPAVYPPNSILAWGQSPEETPEIVLKTQNDNLLFYDVKVDSRNMVWLSAYSYGALVRINANTGEIKLFPVDAVSIRGIAVDEADNVWYANFNGNALGRLDPKTGKSTLFHPPTRFAMPYGIYSDHKNGVIWYSDLGGNQISSFNPRTETFTEYPVPTNNASLHFISQDKSGRIWFTELMQGKIGMLNTGK